MQDNRVMLSIVVTTFNRAGSLTNLIDLLDGQIDLRTEVVVVDDGSSDDTAAVLDEAAAKRDWLRFITTTNGGLSRARNAGAEASRGSWLLFLDDDDLPRPGWAAAFRDRCAMEPQLAVISCGVRYVDSNGEVSRLRDPRPMGPAFADVDGCFLGGATVLRSDVFASTGGFRPDQRTNHMTELMLRLLNGLPTPSSQVVAIHDHLIDIVQAPSGERPRNEPRRLLAGVSEILETHGEVLRRDPSLYADYASVAAVAAVRSGDLETARTWFRRAARQHPTVRTVGRLAVSSINPLARRVWPRDWSPPTPRRAARGRTTATSNADRTSVLVVIDTLGSGGAEESLRTMLPLLAERGIDVDVAVCRANNPDREDDLRGQGVSVRSLGEVSGPIATARALRRELRVSAPDLLHVTLFDPVVGGTIAALSTRVPVLVSIVNTPATHDAAAGSDAEGATWKLWVAQRIEAFACRRLATHVHAVTVGVANNVTTRFGVDPDRVTVSPRGRSAERFHPPSPEERSLARSSVGIQDEEVLLVSLARHEPSKGLLDLVQAMVPVVRDHPQVRLHIAGRDGSQTAALRSLIVERSLGHHVYLVGDVPDPERLLAAADLFVLPSRREGTSGATIEAMATGLPIVATDVEGLVGTTVDRVNVRLARRADPASLASAIDDVLTDDELASRIATGGLRTFETTFEVASASDAMASLYRMVADTRGRRDRAH